MSTSPTSPDLEQASKIPGSASPEVKLLTSEWLTFISGSQTSFASSIANRLVLTAVDIRKKEEEQGREECRVVCEIGVAPDMLNGAGSIHGGCSAFLVDTCSSLPIAGLRKHKNNLVNMAVSQSINMVYHSPATEGDHLRIVSTTITVGARVMSSRCEIWNQTHHRLVASGVHIKMEPSAPPTSKL
ncbi:hypothetical protein JAAARDRAFT_144471 [Jaapia argillacea MUCL 33604]|uniref:Thioesterase domain-containing protein n=1 Tax=Jaapia argillacea MUCL 33604 TaxID=933084 RepID=A0A067QD14_9AGAM|nr:hypothetical protein JAAARDRAFT_144471 [Jaapia argillacea MUCL 33604]